MAVVTTALHVTVVEARNLPEDKKKPFDVFVRVKANFTSQINQTQTKEKTTKPQWNEHFQLECPLKQKQKELHFHVWGSGFIRESIAILKIPLGSDKYIDKWFPLIVEKKYTKLKTQPELRVAVEIEQHSNDNSNSNEVDNESQEIIVEDPIPEVSQPLDQKLSQHRLEEFDEKYHLFGNNELGEGAFSVVFIGENIQSKERVAVKKISKSIIPEDQFEMVKREIDVMGRLHHKNIVKLLDVYENDEYMLLILEYVEGGELYDRLMQGSLKERDAACLILQLVSALSYLHVNNIAHRDLKPENILCVFKDSLYVKIADFGLSKDFSSGALQTCCGTASYVAPEIIKGDFYNCQCDIWSLGVITYLALSGSLPFYDDNEDILFDTILECKYSFDDEKWKTISPKAKNFIEKCLTENPDDRPTSFDLQKHPWLSTAQVKLDMNEVMNEENNSFSFDNYVPKQGKTMG